MGFFGKSVLLTLLALCFFTSSVFALGVNQPGADPLHVLPPIKPPPIPPVIKPPPLPPVIKPPPLPPVIKPPPLPPVIKPPPLPPVIKPPPLPPIKPPTLPSAVRGMVYCKACKSTIVNPLLGAKPVKDATVKLVCKNLKKPIETKTDEKGFFMFLVPKTMTKYISIKNCKTYLVKSPDAKCSKVTNLNGGKIGSFLKPVAKPAKSTVIINKIIYRIFNVGPFAFDPTSCLK